MGLLSRRTKPKTRYFIPDLARERVQTHSDAKLWDIEENRLRTILTTKQKDATRQSMNPIGRLKIPEIGKKDTIFVFAGSGGSVSGKLPNPERVIHSDYNQSRVILARELALPKNIRSAISADFTRLPLKPKSVDWLFSFEPFPIADKPWSLSQAIVTVRKGIIFATSSYKPAQYGIDDAAERYGIKIRKASQKIKDDNKKSESIQYKILEITPEARNKAIIDAKLIDSLNAAKVKHNILKFGDLDRIRKELRLNKEEFKKALDRINKFAGLFPFTVNY